MGKSIALTVAAIAVALAGTVSASANVATAAAAASSHREFQGVVATVNRPARTFTLRDYRRGRVVTIHAGTATRYERRAGFAAIRPGMRLDVHARRAQGFWVATTIDWYNQGGGYHGSDQHWYDDDWDDGWMNGGNGSMHGYGWMNGGSGWMGPMM